METPEITLDLTTVVVKGKEYPLKTRKDYIKRIPRKLKKRLKKIYGTGYDAWLNTPMKWISEFPPNIYNYYNVDVVRELTEMLLNELDNENKKNT